MATKDGCIFCDIITKNDPEIIQYQQDDLVIIKDLHPISKQHYLVLSRDHIPDAKSLTLANKPLVENMVLKGKEILEKNGGSVEESRFGFHWPPFQSISHLHMHCINPVKDIGFVGKMIFLQNSWWFVSPEYILKRIGN